LSRLKIAETSENVSKIDDVLTSVVDPDGVDEAKLLLENLKTKKDELESQLIELQVILSYFLGNTN
jgi:hypothetical protein